MSVMNEVSSAATAQYTDLVSFTLSGSYDQHQPILIDAADPSRSVSRACAIELVARLAGAFEPGSTVCLHLPNDVTYPILTLAILASQCRWTGVNIAYTKFELEHVFRTAAVRYVVAREEDLDKVDAAVAASGAAIEVVKFADLLRPAIRSPPTQNETVTSKNSNSKRIEALPIIRPDARKSLHDLFRPAIDGACGERALRRQLAKVQSGSIAALMSTSGTTGLPKMAARTHGAMIAEALAIADNHAEKPYEVRRLISTPIFHAFSCPEMMFNALRLGLTTYFLPRYQDSVFAALVAEHLITEIFAPPPMLLALLDNRDAHAQLQSLRAVYTGGAPLAAALAESFRAIFPAERPIRIVQVWGMTEGGWFTTFKYPDEADVSSGAVGYALAGMEVAILARDDFTRVNESDASSPVLGEILVRGPQVMQGYFNNEHATREAFLPAESLPQQCVRTQSPYPDPSSSTFSSECQNRRAWLRTGDVGYLRLADSAVILVDRVKDLIKVNGFQVAPAEIEDALLSHPLVADAGVVGMEYTPAEQMDSSAEVHATQDREKTDIPLCSRHENVFGEERPVAFVVLRSAPSSISSSFSSQSWTAAASPAASCVSSFSSVQSVGSLDTDISDLYAIENDIKLWLLQRLARYKISRCHIRFTDRIPKSPAGKIMRTELRKQAS